MSIEGNLRRVTADELRTLLAHPEQVFGFLYPEPEEESEGMTLWYEEHHLPLAKGWHALHFLLTGTSWEGAPPLNFIAAGGQKVGEEDVGYGPARSFTPEQVREISRALDALRPEDLRQRYDPARMDELEIYPAHSWKANASEDVAHMLLGDFEGLRDFVREGAEQGMGLLAYLN